MTGVLTAGSGQQWESDLVAALEQPGSPLTVVRRCADITEVLASAATGRARVAVVDGSLRRLDTEAVQRLQASGVAVIGIHPAGDQRARVRLERLGVIEMIPDDAGPAVVLAAALTAMTVLESRPRQGDGPADPRRALPPTVTVIAEPPPSAAPPVAGRLIAVWGPTGAPGRTTIAAGLADALSTAGLPTLLIDADVYGGIMGSAFGVLDESAGLAGACRLAANGRLAAPELDKLCWALSPTLRLLTGISRADRWPELRPSALPRVLAAARAMAPVTVVDCGFGLETDEELSFDTVAPRRNGATLSVLAAADRVLAVGSADPPGMERLIRGLAELREALPEVRPEVVLNRVRSSAGSGGQALDALRRFTGLTQAFQIPENRSATDAAWTQGVALSVAAPTSDLRAALTAMAVALMPQRQHV